MIINGNSAMHPARCSRKLSFLRGNLNQLFGMTAFSLIIILLRKMANLILYRILRLMLLSWIAGKKGWAELCVGSAHRMWCVKWNMWRHPRQASLEVMLVMIKINVSFPHFACWNSYWESGSMTKKKNVPVKFVLYSIFYRIYLKMWLIK